jgi:cell division protein FtsL
MTLMLIFVGMVGVAMVIASSWMTAIQFDINRISKATTELHSEIEKLAVNIERGTSISVIEYRATSELGMIYPSAEQVVYLEEEPAAVNDFAQYIKENAYVIW